MTGRGVGGLIEAWVRARGSSLNKGNEMTMASFYSECGNFLRSEQSVLGEFPARQFVVTFVYVNGTASFNGRDWTFVLGL